MEYNDSIRRYNFLAGLGIGAVLGVGLAVLALPQKKVLRQAVRGSRRSGRAGKKLPRPGSRGGAESQPAGGGLKRFSGRRRSESDR